MKLFLLLRLSVICNGLQASTCWKNEFNSFLTRLSTLLCAFYCVTQKAIFIPFHSSSSSPAFLSLYKYFYFHSTLSTFLSYSFFRNVFINMNFVQEQIYLLNFPCNLVHISINTHAHTHSREEFVKKYFNSKLRAMCYFSSCTTKRVDFLKDENDTKKNLTKMKILIICGHER